jgi:hypothetical protein
MTTSMTTPDSLRALPRIELGSTAQAQRALVRRVSLVAPAAEIQKVDLRCCTVGTDGVEFWRS